MPSEAKRECYLQLIIQRAIAFPSYVEVSNQLDSKQALTGNCPADRPIFPVHPLKQFGQSATTWRPSSEMHLSRLTGCPAAGYRAKAQSPSIRPVVCVDSGRLGLTIVQ
jgi:hypothetical protein